MSRNAKFAENTRTSAEPEQRRPLSYRPPHHHSGVYRRSHGQRRSIPAEEREDLVPPPSAAWSVLIAITTLGLVYLLMQIGNHA
jgi:hypothetical protein